MKQFREHFGVVPVWPGEWVFETRTCGCDIDLTDALAVDPVVQRHKLVRPQRKKWPTKDPLGIKRRSESLAFLNIQTRVMGLHMALQQ
jgi:hypothetical protein